MFLRYIVSMVVAGTFGLVLAGAAASDKAKSRTFELAYHAKIEGLAPGQSYRLWMPMPRTNGHQEVTDLMDKLPGQVTTEGRFGNRMLYVEGVANTQGLASCTTSYRIVRKEVTGEGMAPSGAEATRGT